MKLLPCLLAALPFNSAQKPPKEPKECMFTGWSNWSECSWLCGPSGTKERTRAIRLPKNGPCLSNGLEPELKEVEACNRTCMNGGKMSSTKCMCKSSYTGICCESAKSASVDRCDKRIRKPDGGTMKCGRSKAPALEGYLPWNWSCTPRCPPGKGMYRAHGDLYQCNSQGWIQQSFQQRSFDFDDYDDDTPTLPLADCADRKMIMGTKESLRLVYVTTMEPALLQSMIDSEDPNAAIPQSLLSTINQQCAKQTSGTYLRFNAEYTVTMGNGLGKTRSRQRRDEALGLDEAADIAAAPAAATTPVVDAPTNASTEDVVIESMSASQDGLMLFDVQLPGLPETEMAEGDESGKSAIAGIPFTVAVDFNFMGKQPKNINWNTQELARKLMRDCIGSVLTHFKEDFAQDTDESLEGAGVTVASQHTIPADMEEAYWPHWDREGSGCAAGSTLVGGTVQEALMCQACPRGTVYLTKQKGAREICRPCPSGSYMAEEGSVANDAGELGVCNACASPAFMTNTFPAYSKSTCIKTSCFPNRTKFQVVFALDSSGSVTRPDYIRMREFAKSIVNRMCINNSHDSGSKSCGQAAYVIYNQSAESYMKFKQVESQVDFNKIDNYEYRGGPARIGDLFEFIHDTYIDTDQLKNGLPLVVVLFSDGQTQNDDKEHMEAMTRKLKKKVTKIITLSKRSEWNGNTLQLASTVEDRYFMNDYHELSGFVYPVMEKLCQSIPLHKGQLLRAKKLKIEKRRGGKNGGRPMV